MSQAKKMSLVKTLHVRVTQNKLLRTVAKVPQWEAHVLLAAWGEDAEVISEQFVDRVVPDTHDEFQRLADKYGPKDEDTPYVAKVFGSFGPGLRALENEIQISIKGASATQALPTISERANAAGVDLAKTAPAEDFSELIGADSESEAVTKVVTKKQRRKFSL